MSRRALPALLLGAVTGAAGVLLGCQSLRPSRPAPTPGEAARAPDSPRLAMSSPVVRGKPRPGGTFTQAIPAAFRQHDAHTALGISAWHIISERAVDIDPVSGRLLPNLVQSWETSDRQGLEVVLRLRPGIRMHDRPSTNGRVFDAEDLAFNLRRAAGMTAEAERLPVAAFQRASLLANLTSAEAVDGTTVRVRFGSPNSAFLNGLADGRMLMMPREVTSIGFTDPMKLGGPGPFEVAEWRPESTLRFRRFGAYFRPGEPHFADFVAAVIPDPAAQEAAFITNQTQLMPAPSQQHAERVLAARTDALLYEWMDTSWQHVRPNMEHPALADTRVRKALSMAIDREALANAVFGRGWEYQSALNPAYPEAWAPAEVRELPGFNSRTRERDRQEAARLLHAAGFEQGAGLRFGMTFAATNEPARENATRLQAQFAGAFPSADITLRPVQDAAVFAVRQASRSFDAVSYVSTAAPDAVLELAAHYRTGGSRNYGGCSDVIADDLLDRALAEVRLDVRAELLDRFQRHFAHDWVPMLVLYAQPARNLLAGNIGGYDQTAGPWYGFGSASRGSRWYYVD